MNKNIYWDEFLKAKDKNEFVLNLATDLRNFFEKEEHIKLDRIGNKEDCNYNLSYIKVEDNDGFMYPKLMDTVTYDEDECLIVLDNEEEIGYEDLLLCFQPILDGPMMLLAEESMFNFFELVFNKDFDSFMGNEVNKISTIEKDGVKAYYYTQVREDGVIFSGVLFD